MNHGGSVKEWLSNPFHQYWARSECHLVVYTHSSIVPKYYQSAEKMKAIWLNWIIHINIYNHIGETGDIYILTTGYILVISKKYSDLLTRSIYSTISHLNQHLWLYLFVFSALRFLALWGNILALLFLHFWCSRFGAQTQTPYFETSLFCFSTLFKFLIDSLIPMKIIWRTCSCWVIVVVLRDDHCDVRVWRHSPPLD